MKKTKNKKTEKPPQWEARIPQLESLRLSATAEKAHLQQWRSSTAKINHIYIYMCVFKEKKDYCLKKQKVTWPLSHC